MSFVKQYNYICVLLKIASSKTKAKPLNSVLKPTFFLSKCVTYIIALDIVYSSCSSVFHCVFPWIALRYVCILINRFHYLPIFPFTPLLKQVRNEKCRYILPIFCLPSFTLNETNLHRMTQIKSENCLPNWRQPVLTSRFPAPLSFTPRPVPRSFTAMLSTSEESESVFTFSGGSRIFQMGGRCFVTNGGAHILFSGKKCMKLKEIGLKWGGGACLLAPCYSKITIFLWIILNSIMKTSYFTYFENNLLKRPPGSLGAMVLLQNCSFDT